MVINIYSFLVNKYILIRSASYNPIIRGKLYLILVCKRKGDENKLII